MTREECSEKIEKPRNLYETVDTWDSYANYGLSIGFAGMKGNIQRDITELEHFLNHGGELSERLKRPWA